MSATATTTHVVCETRFIVADGHQVVAGELIAADFKNLPQMLRVGYVREASPRELAHMECCPECDATFIDEESMQMHIRRCHPDAKKKGAKRAAAGQ